MKREHLWAHHERNLTSHWSLAEGGYASRMSVRQGETITLHISNSRSYYDIFVFREGGQRQLMTTIPLQRGQLHSIPQDGYCEGFGWPPTVELAVGDDWPSGVYIAAFASGQGPREILFVVRPCQPRSPALLTIAANTYAAYNNVGGKCFYDFFSTDRQRCDLVSFQRPLQSGVMGNFHFWDQFFTSWADAEGYAIDYAVNADHEAEPGLLQSYKANIRIGHDEYNTIDECRQLQQFVRGGGNLLLFAGNSFYHEVEYRQDRHQLYCQKPHYHDPPMPGEKTQMLSHQDDLRQNTIGVFYTGFVHAKTEDPDVFIAPITEGYGGYCVTDADHWVFAGTGLRSGDPFGLEDSIAGVEVDAAEIEFVDGQPRYTGRDGVSPDYRIVALCDCIVQNDRVMNRRSQGRGDMAKTFGTIALNETQFKGVVFNAATIEWGHGLNCDDSVVAKITRNVLNRLAR